MIRQVTISCQERGLLLLRVRDEIRMSIAAYQTLYESSVAFGMRKALQAEQGKTDMDNRVNSFIYNKLIWGFRLKNWRKRKDNWNKRYLNGKLNVKLLKNERVKEERWRNVNMQRKFLS